VSRRDAVGDPPVERFERVGEAARDVQDHLVLEQAIKRRPPHVSLHSLLEKVRAGGMRERGRFGRVISTAARRPG